MRFSSIWVLPLAVALLQGSGAERPALRMTMQYGTTANANHRTIYLQRDRERLEYRAFLGRERDAEPIYGPRLARIIRCDLGQTFELNLETSEYTSAPYPPKSLTQDELKARGLDRPVASPSAKPTLRIEIKTTDTGERKDMFGHVARHVITTTTQTPLEGSHSEPQQSVTDAWYIDFDQQLSCDPKRHASGQGYIYGFVTAGLGRQPIEKPEFVRIGNPETGIALDSRTTSKSPPNLPDGTISNFETRVTAFDEGPLDPALFEIPPGFKHVDQIERNPAKSTIARKP